MKYPGIFLLASFAIFFVVSCNNRDNTDPYSKILEMPLFRSVTDSIRKQPANDELYFRRAVLLNLNKYPEPALRDFQKAWELKKHEKYAYGISNLLLDKDADSAMIFLKDALKILPGSFLLELTLARALLNSNRLDEALAICNEMLSKNPGQADVLRLKAEILDGKGDLTNTIETLYQAYAINPSDIELNHALAFKLAEAKDKRVISLCDSLILVDSLGIHAEPYYYKGIYYSNMNDPGKAMAFFDQSIKVDHNFLESYIEKGSILYDQKKYDQALLVFNLCLTISPKFADAYYWIAKCQQATGKKEEARLNYQRAYSLDPSNTEAKKAADELGK